MGAGQAAAPVEPGSTTAAVDVIMTFQLQ